MYHIFSEDRIRATEIALGIPYGILFESHDKNHGETPGQLEQEVGGKFKPWFKVTIDLGKEEVTFSEFVDS